MPQIRQKLQFSANGQSMFGHQVGICHHVGAAIVVVKAILCIGKDLGISTMAYASLTVELQLDGYTRRWENPDFSREILLIDSDVWAPTTTLLCSIFLPVLVKAIPYIGKDLGMSTMAYASLTVELQLDGYTRRWENPDFSREILLIDSDVWAPTTTLLCSIFLPVLVKAIPCIGKDLGMSTMAYASLTVELQ